MRQQASFSFPKHVIRQEKALHPIGQRCTLIFCDILLVAIYIHTRKGAMYLENRLQCVAIDTVVRDTDSASLVSDNNSKRAKNSG